MRWMSSQNVLPYYNQYFGVKFPLPKLDLIAIPGNYEAGAMENWGAITFIDDAMLFDPKTSSPQTREEIHLGGRARDGASMVGRSGDHGLVGTISG